MARISYGPQVQRRTKLLLTALLAYANDDLGDCDRASDDLSVRIAPNLKINWQTNRQLVVRTKVRFLQELTAVVQDTLSTDQIKEALKRLEDFLEILEDNRPSSQGSDVWHFTLKLWHDRKDVTANLKRFDQEWQQRRSSGFSPPSTNVSTQVDLEALPKDASPEKQPIQSQDWGDALDVYTFYGRRQELKILSHWLVENQCRLVLLLGMGGIGKTALAAKLAQQIQAEFDYLIWRSLRNAPPIQELLTELLTFLSNQQTTDLSDSDLPDSIDGKLAQMGQYLQSARCLIVLDNLEPILSNDDSTGAYRAGYEGYGQLLRWVGETQHQSCLLLTSREKPRGLGAKETKEGPIRSLQLSGLENTSAQALLREKDCSISADEGQALVQSYGGNPLALKIVATTIQELFGGETARFLDQGMTVFGDIEDLLEQQFGRLSFLEQQVMTWLALRREWSTISELQQDLYPPVLLPDLLAVLEALQRRSLIEKQVATFTQQPVVMEYVTGCFIAQVCEEIQAGRIDSLNCYALSQAQAKDYIREAQARLVLRPVIERLLGLLGPASVVKGYLDRLLQALKLSPLRSPGYGAGNVLNLLHQLDIDLSGYDFSNLVLWQVCFPEMTLPRVNLTGADLSRSVFTQTTGVMMSAAFSPDGLQLATGIGHDIVLWQLADGKQLTLMVGHSSWVVSVAFSPDGQHLVSGSHDQQVRLWDVATGQCVKTLVGHTSRVESVAFSPDGRWLASASNDQTIRIWEVARNRCCHVLAGHCDRILQICFTPNSQTLVSGSHDQTVRLWDLTTGEEIQRLETAINWKLAMALSPDGQRLATGSDGKVVKIWELATGNCLLTLPNYHSHVWSVDFSPDGRWLATGGDDRTVRLWDAQTGECLRTLQVHTHLVWLVAFSPVVSPGNAQTLISISDDRTLKVWDVASGQCLRTLRVYSHRIEAVAFSPDGQTLVSGGEDWRLRLWDMATEQCLKTLQGHDNVVSAVAYSPNGETLVSGSHDQTIKLWDVQTGRCLRTFWGHQGWVHNVVFHPDGTQVVSGGYDHTIKLWDARSGECLQTFEGHIHRVKTVALNGQGTMLASGSDDQTVKLWEMETGVCVQTLQEHTDWVVSVAFQPSTEGGASGVLASAGDQTVRLWDIDTGKCEQVLMGHQGRVRWVAWSPDGQWLTSCGTDRTLRLWDVSSGECLWGVEHPSPEVWAVAFSPDGETIASVGQDETIRLWRASNGDFARGFTIQRPYEGMDITGVVGLTMAQRSTLKALGAVESE
ncbi:WD40 domain-containing protein [Leptothoe spongobia]|uniref:AAA family ATPase n=1 Tax=Leptothoe spongobia TAU-MAC 1115 TaxID=1967444 RepID=A0A947GKZ4_9CYAN|nr:NB-ARC domain-containing protein [Leptothoe spongobia]MBT9317949.1 AAA family ATPase [Leptothoe spongobia TAU-MAC 1115]